MISRSVKRLRNCWIICWIIILTKGVGKMSTLWSSKWLSSRTGILWTSISLMTASWMIKCSKIISISIRPIVITILVVIRLLKTSLQIITAINNWKLFSNQHMKIVASNLKESILKMKWVLNNSRILDNKYNSKQSPFNRSVSISKTYKRK